MVTRELISDIFRARSLDAIVGHYVFHHIDLLTIGSAVGDILVPDGRGAFVETAGLNPLLRLSRRWLAGRAGVASYGSVTARRMSLQSRLPIVAFFSRPLAAWLWRLARWPLSGFSIATYGATGGRECQRSWRHLKSQSECI